MKKTFILLLIVLSINRSSAQGSLQVTAGANITGSGTSWIVLDNMNVVNNGSILLSTSGNTVKTTGALSTTQSGIGTTQLNNLTNDKTTATFTLAEPVLLYNQLNLTTGILASAGFLNLKSTATNTAMVLPVPVGATATGDVTAERFISAAFARSAWRLLTAPLRSGTGTNGTIFANWQNNGGNTPGIDTRVTGPVNNGGLDGITPGPSMRWFDMATGTLQNVTTTNDPLITPLFTTAPSAANRSYFTFIDGDRLTPPMSSSTTTLSALGNLQIGNQAFATNTVADGFALIGNPYASPVDLDLFRQTNTAAGNNIKSTYYYWDPYLTGVYGVGAYVTVSYDGVGNSYTITPGTAAETRHLQSGQAMYVQTKNPAAGIPSAIFTETQKSVTNVNNIFRTQAGNIESVRINLNVLSSGSPVLVDGIVTTFDNSYAAAIDNFDAVKLYNVGESIAFMRDSKAFAIERRPMVKSEDILYLNLTNLRANKEYQFEIKPDMNASGLNAWLKDNYLNAYSPVDLKTPTTINFTINADAASTGSNRFSIVFAKPGIVQNVKPGMSVYPNPVTNGIINLQMSNMPQGMYNVRVFNSMGQIILNRQINHSAGNNIEIIQLGKGAAKGSYQIEVVKPDNTKFSSSIIFY